MIFTVNRTIRKEVEVEEEVAYELIKFYVIRIISNVSSVKKCINEVRLNHKPNEREIGEALIPYEGQPVFATVEENYELEQVNFTKTPDHTIDNFNKEYADLHKNLKSDLNTLKALVVNEFHKKEQRLQNEKSFYGPGDNEQMKLSDSLLKDLNSDKVSTLARIVNCENCIENFFNNMK